MNLVPNRTRQLRGDGFTIIELLVVVSVIALLMALILPSLGGARAKARKTQEAAAIRQVGNAWAVYANQHNDRALPGYVQPDVQAAWNLRARYPEDTLVDPIDAAPWTWRMAGLLDYDYNTIRGYSTDEWQDPNAMAANGGTIATSPGFSYNGYYVGGYWQMEVMGGGDPVARPRYASVDDPDGNAASVVNQSISAIRRSSEVAVFTTAAVLNVGYHKKGSFQDDDRGWHFATPPWLAQTEYWNRGANGGNGPMFGAGDGDDDDVEVFLSAPPNSPIGIPVGRYNGAAIIYHADGSTRTTSPGSMADMRVWIDDAEAFDWTHSE